MWWDKAKTNDKNFQKYLNRSYVATTRGSQHVADLPGHLESVASTNVQPAAGTL